MASSCLHMKGKVVVVTGAGGRLGQRLVARLQGVSAQVIAVGNAGTEDITLDLTDEGEVVDAFERIQREHNGMDVLVHAVGTWNEWPLLETKLDDWEHMIKINLTTSFLCFREAARHMVDEGGTIIGICARSGLETAVAQGGAYAASKAGLMRLVEAVSAEHPTLNTYALAPSVIRYGNSSGSGVNADDLVELAIQLCSEPARAMSGTALRAYGMHSQ